MNALHRPFIPWTGHSAHSGQRPRFGAALPAVAAAAVAGFVLLLTLGGGTTQAPDTELPTNFAPSSIEIDPFAAEKKNALIEELPAQF
jgi:hypothetical protein